MRPSAGVWGVLAIGGVLLAARATAQDARISVPVEYTSGFVASGPPPRFFAGGLRSAVLARLGREQTGVAGLVGGFVHDDQGWTAVGGARVGLRLPSLGMRDAGVFLVAEGLKGRDRAPLSLTLLLDLPIRSAGFARFGATFAHDLDRDHDAVMLMVGVDLARWVAELRGRGDGPHTVDR